MKKEIPILPIPSIDYFRALYDLVGDGVFLYSQSEDSIVEGNEAFRNKLAIDDGELRGLSLTCLFPGNVPTLRAGEVINTVLAPEGSLAYPVKLHIRAASLADKPLFLCVLNDQDTLQESLQRLAAAETEKKELLKEVYHRVKNNLNIIISLLGLQLSRVTDAQMRHVLTESKSRIYALALLQERLYHSPRLAEVKANEYLTCLAQSVMATFKETTQQITFAARTSDSWLTVDTLVPLGLLVHELVANAVLHAFPPGYSGEVSLSFFELEPGIFQLVVQDTGKGFPEGTTFANFNTLGSKLIMSLSRQLKADLALESEFSKGTKITLKFSTLQQHGRV